MPESTHLDAYKKYWESSDWSRFIDLDNLESVEFEDASDIALMIAGAAFF